IMGLMMLAASPGCTIDIEAAGADAPQAMDALVTLIGNRFDEDE
ncbi:MAG TPA: HPr family phosphocarrier protein, partial [Tistrella mobilis]|nr:HPr family phosphocarrier protein [Tistrella mobilis]